MKVNTLLKLLALILYFSSFFFVLWLPFKLTQDIFNAIIFSISIGTTYIFLCDLSFRFFYKFIKKHPYIIRDKIPFNQIYIEPHPFLPFILKKNFTGPKKQPAGYPLNSGKNYWFPQFYTNNLGYFNGIDGNRDIVTPKPKALFRINCLGASTTSNYILDNNKIFSYPTQLERILHTNFPEKNIEVNNFAMGGMTSPEILIEFLLRSIDTNPDMIVLYHAYNDLGPSLTSGFKSDYSHAKRNFGESYHILKWASRVPYIPFALPNFLLSLVVPQNLKFGLLDILTKGTINLDDAFCGLDTYKRNINNLINICKANGIKVVISTYCHFLYPEIEKDKAHLKYRSGVLEENSAVRELARVHQLPLVDNFKLVPYEEKYFVDSIHFSPSGMQEVANNISKPIISYLNSKNKPL
jgi:lysophospholipase L1-like esterase